VAGLAGEGSPLLLCVMQSATSEITDKLKEDCYDKNE
jgi:hypothetical protein